MCLRVRTACVPMCERRWPPSLPGMWAGPWVALRAWASAAHRASWAHTLPVLLVMCLQEPRESILFLTTVRGAEIWGEQDGTCP